MPSRQIHTPEPRQSSIRRFKPGSRLLAGLAIACLAQFSGRAFAQQGFVGGKPVSASVYKAAQLVNESLELIRLNKNQEAADKLATAIELAPDLAEAHHNLGLAFAKLGKYPEAIAEMKRALALKPDLPSTWLTLGGLYQSSGQLENALYYYGEFAKRFPTHSEIPKIKSLTKGLEGELAKLQVPSRAGGESSAEDYYADITQQGILRWPAKRMPLKIYIQPGEGVPQYRPGFSKALDKAIDDWASASGGLVSFTRVASPQNANIICSWTNDPRQLGNPAEAGEAKVYTDAQGISRGTIKLLTIPLSPELPLTDTRMHLNCLHELGHALGLGGHTSNPADVMFYTAPLTDSERVLTSRDANTIIRLYSNN